MPHSDEANENIEFEQGAEQLEDLENFEDYDELEMTSSDDLAEAVTQITGRVLDTIESAAAVRDGFFFPKGIDLIEVSVDINGIQASVKIAGRTGS